MKQRNTRYTYGEVKASFENKDYTLISKTYKNTNDKLVYICNKHKDFGMQKVSFSSLKLNDNNCELCASISRKENRHKSINFKPITNEEFREKHFDNYKDKVYQKYGDEYELIDVYRETKKTKLSLIHNKCGKIYRVAQHDFLHDISQCTNRECRSQRIRDKKLKTIDQFKSEVHELVGDDYFVFGEYTGTHDNIGFVHNVCNHKFQMHPNNFLRGQRCPKCAIEIVTKKNTKTHNQYCKEVYELFGDEYEILGKYKNAQSSIKIRHNKCNKVFEIQSHKIFINNCPCQYCASPSSGEQSIIGFLDDCLTDNYIHQKYFDDLLGVGGGQLSYDFYLPTYNLLIEYQGVQHERPVELFGGEEQFKVQQEHDRRKRGYANKNKIKLLEIWYYDFDNIDEILSKELNIPLDNVL